MLHLLALAPPGGTPSLQSPRQVSAQGHALEGLSDETPGRSAIISPGWAGLVQARPTISLVFCVVRWKSV